MIKEVIIKSFLDRLDYCIPFNSEEDNLTFITGPMGFGKSLILKMIYNAYEQNLSFFNDIQFSSLTILEEKGKYIKVIKDKDTILSEVNSDSFVRFYSYELGTILYKEHNELDPLKEHFSNGKNVLIDSYYKQALENPSEGEANLVNLYKVLFNDKSPILLLDNIETNLHMADIEIVSNNLLKVAENKQLIIATHSPALINGRWDNTIDLFTLTREHE